MLRTGLVTHPHMIDQVSGNPSAQSDGLKPAIKKPAASPVHLDDLCNGIPERIQMNKNTSYQQ